MSWPNTSVPPCVRLVEWAGWCARLSKTRGREKRPHSRRCSSAPAPMWQGATGPSRCAITSGEGSTTPESGPA
jgi:hypothetical protein